MAADGALWVWGGNGCGQLGLGSRQEFVDTPCKPPMLGPVAGKSACARFVDCGERHTAVLLESGDVYTAGSNEYGACGIADDFAEVGAGFAAGRLALCLLHTLHFDVAEWI